MLQLLHLLAGGKGRTSLMMQPFDVSHMQESIGKVGGKYFVIIHTMYTYVKAATKMY